MALIFEQGFNLAPKGAEIQRCGMAIGVELNGTVAWIGKDLEGADLTPTYNDKVIETIWNESIDKSTIGVLETTFDPFGLIGTGTASTGDTLGDFQAQLLESLLNKDLGGMKAPAIIAFKFAGTSGAWRAKRYGESTWKPQSTGGTGADKILKFPIKVIFAGVESIGTVDKMPPESLTGIFTADTVI